MSTSIEMNPLEKLLIEQACKDLTALYADAVNRWNIDDFVNLFARDAVWQRPNVPPLEGQTQIRAFMESQPTERVLRHINGHVLVWVETIDSARGLSTTTVYDTPGIHDYPAPLTSPDMVVEYRDRYVRLPEGWRIARRDTTVVFST